MAQRQYQLIAERIKRELTEARYIPGTRLPTERDYAERFEVSRTVVREAFIMLEIEGHVEVRKGSGTYLLDAGQQDDPSTPTMSVVSQEDIGPFELLHARQVIESAIAASAARLVTRHDIQALQELLERERLSLAAEHQTTAKAEESDAADRGFHLLIARASQNTLLHDTTAQLWDQRHRSPMWQRLHERIKDFSYRRDWLEDHDVILARLKKRDADGAHQAMWNHLEHVKQTLFALSDTDDPNFDGYLFVTPEGSATARS
ncbi:FCD domain-containing protein [Phytohalomonas tamaricis]|uniref:FCD domain-containing protein n=1 Tax=Phytohalomonas tamaricis TaxID=2081032 RepID=UPI000D0B4298|nr:FCD domain-containing protein [Phytohalomonas tamaricis]